MKDIKIIFYLHKVSKLVKLTHSYGNHNGFCSWELLSGRKNQGPSWVLKLLYTLLLVVVTKVYIYLQIYHSVHFRFMYFSRCKLYLNKNFLIHKLTEAKKIKRIDDIFLVEFILAISLIKARKTLFFM